MILNFIKKKLIYEDWKRYANFTLSVFHSNSNFEKTLDSNNTFRKDKKDIGLIESISNFDLKKEGEIIVETNVIY